MGSGFHAGWERAAAALSPVPHEQNWTIVTSLGGDVRLREWRRPSLRVETSAFENDGILIETVIGYCSKRHPVFTRFYFRVQVLGSRCRGKLPSLSGNERY